MTIAAGAQLGPYEILSPLLGRVALHELLPIASQIAEALE